MMADHKRDAIIDKLMCKFNLESIWHQRIFIAPMNDGDDWVMICGAHGRNNTYSRRNIKARLSAIERQKMDFCFSNLFCQNIGNAFSIWMPHKINVCFLKIIL